MKTVKCYVAFLTNLVHLEAVKTCSSEAEEDKMHKKSLPFYGRLFRAKDEIRTRDPNLGKVVLYQLSYFR